MASHYIMFAIIKTGSKQYIVEPEQTISIEKLNAEEGETVTFDDVLLYADGETTKVGTPTLEGVTVQGEVIKQKRDKKKIVFKYHSKTRYRKKKGHRQPLTEVKITTIKV